MGLLELMAGVVVAALVLAALRANGLVGGVLLALLPLTALRARAVLRADRAAGRPAGVGRIARAWAGSLGRVAAAFGVALLLTTFLLSLAGAAIGLAAEALRLRDAAGALRHSAALTAGLLLAGVALVGAITTRLLQAHWPNQAGSPAGREGRGRMGDVDRGDDPRAGRAGPAPGAVRPIDEGDAAS
jgi:hypothetical protein